jgi:hypothetical protein
MRAMMYPANKQTADITQQHTPVNEFFPLLATQQYASVGM